MGRVGAITKNKIEKKYFYFFFNFRKFGSVGSVKRKIKKLWPYSLLLFIHCFLLLPLCVGFFSVGSLFCDVVLSALSSFVIISLRKRDLVALTLYSIITHFDAFEIPRT